MIPDEYLDIQIIKPIHGTYCSIDFRKLKEAVRDHKELRITILGMGTATVDPRWWYNTSPKKEKRVMKYADNPMTLVYNTVPLTSYYKRNGEKPVNQLSIF